MDLNLRIAHLKECDVTDEEERDEAVERQPCKKRSRSPDAEELKEGSDAVAEEDVKRKRKSKTSVKAKDAEDSNAK